ncbi:MAG: hypothetical protein QNJ42_13855 [Crocosphaera sp.]|nr:hypothetical protein [Crocosphaera sp.]
MTIEYQFTDVNKWSLFWSENLTAPYAQSGLERFYSLGRISPPTLLEKPIIGVWCKNSEAKPNWRYAARYFITIQTGLSPDIGIPNTVIKTGKLYLDQVEIIHIPSISSTFALEIDIPYWHRKFRINVFEYIGNDQNTIHRKLDDLLGYPQP